MSQEVTEIETPIEPQEPIEEVSEQIKRMRLEILGDVTRCAIELYRKIGTTNVQSYSENGLSVTYMTGLISSSLMNELVPKAGVPK